MFVLCGKLTGFFSVFDSACQLYIHTMGKKMTIAAKKFITISLVNVPESPSAKTVKSQEIICTFYMSD